MKISYNWLSSYFDSPLPQPTEVGSLLTNHAFEIESIEQFEKDFVLDIKVLPDRAHDCLSHLGIAKEVSALSRIPLKNEFLVSKTLSVPESNIFRVEVTNSKACPRFSALVIEHVEVRESPVWLQDRIRAIGQRPINNIVDATNYVMFATGQPLHAYDLELLTKTEGGYKILVRNASDGETLTALDNKMYTLSNDTLVIADGNTDTPLGIAGVKGGKASEITSKTKHIVLEAANFEPIQVRKTAKRLGQRTDASVRFENAITPELTEHALATITDLIMDIAKTDSIQVEGFCDVYPRKQNPYTVGVSVLEVQKTLGIDISKSEIENILNQRKFDWKEVTPQDEIVKQLTVYIDAPYKIGASVSFDAPHMFDCSSFVSYICTQVGHSIPRMSVDQFVFGNLVQAHELQIGDLVFSNSGEGTIHTESVEWMKGTLVSEGVDHVGMYAGDGFVVHATRKKGSVTREKVSESESFKRIVGYRRVLSDEQRYVVTVPSERLDLRMKEDIIEEIGRTYGYQTLQAKPITVSQEKVINPNSVEYGNIIRNVCIEHGFSEIYSYAFRNTGKVELMNPVAQDKSFLRASLSDALTVILDQNKKNSDVLGLTDICIFEIGTVFSDTEEHISCAYAVSNIKHAETIQQKIHDAVGLGFNWVQQGNVFETNIEAGIVQLQSPEKNYVYSDTRSYAYKPFSLYPVIVRDMAVFIPEGKQGALVVDTVQSVAGDLLVRTRLFDTFTKEFPEGRKTSYGYRFVFQSKEKTLTDEEVNAIITKASQILHTIEGVTVR